MQVILQSKPTELVILPSGVALSEDVIPDGVTGEVRYGYEFSEADVAFLTQLGATFPEEL